MQPQTHYTQAAPAPNVNEMHKAFTTWCGSNNSTSPKVLASAKGIQVLAGLRSVSLPFLFWRKRYEIIANVSFSGNLGASHIPQSQHNHKTSYNAVYTGVSAMLNTAFGRHNIGITFRRVFLHLAFFMATGANNGQSELREGQHRDIAGVPLFFFSSKI